MLLLSQNSFGQEWRHRTQPGHFFGVQDYWGESGEYQAEFVVWNLEAKYTSVVPNESDNWVDVHFPFDFNLVLGRPVDTVAELYWAVKVGKQTVLQGSFMYDPSPNRFFQLEYFDPITLDKPKEIWGTILDAYSWEDQKGQNVFIRSFLDVKDMVIDGKKTRGRYLYVYHYRKKGDEYVLLRKLTDVVSECTGNMESDHIIESIELTDVNYDTIAEISFFYTSDCINDSSDSVYSKLMMLTDGKKYAIRGRISYTMSTNDYELGKYLRKTAIIRKFMEEKWFSLNY